MVQLTIKVTKEILERSKDCRNEDLAEHCAIREAIHPIFPFSMVGVDMILPYGFMVEAPDISIPLTNEVQEFIKGFDNTPPNLRPFLSEIEFTIDIPDAIIERIDIDEIRPLLVNHPTLTLIEA